MQQLAVSAIGRDRPGIVAAVTRDLLEHGLNIEDSQMSILRGHFAMTLVVGGGEDLDVAALASSLERTGAELGLEAISVGAVSDLEGEPGVQASHIATVYGTDHPGIVHAVAALLARKGVSITDLNTRLVEEEGGEPLYVMMLELAVPRGFDPAALERELSRVGGEQGVEVTMRELERDVL